MLQDYGGGSVWSIESMCNIVGHILYSVNRGEASSQYSVDYN